MGLFDSIKSKAAGTPTTSPQGEKELAIMDIERRMHSLEQASLNEISVLKSKIAEECRKVGEATHEMYAAGNLDIENTKALLDGITDLKQAVYEKETKLDEILSRYSEELLILRPPQPSGQAFCEGCGSGYDSGEDDFCTNCGAQLT